MSSSRQTLYLSDGSSVTLTPAQYLSTGGEGAVYRKDQRIYKLYLDPTKAARAGLADKVEKLRGFQHPGIAAPQDILRNKQGEFVGIVMPFAQGEALCRLFTNTWRQAQGFDDVQAARVVSSMRDITQYAHDRQALMVDANEMNWVVHGTNPVAIDVDSWQLPGFAATAIMPSIRDWSASAFDEGTDWFAWAVVTFQLWTGIHPYKGTHPDFARADLQGRMKARASVFDAKVRLPAAARPVQGIPAALRAWYEQTFASSQRSAPPASFDASPRPVATSRLRVVQSASAHLRVERLGQPGSTVLAAFQGFVLAQDGQRLLLWDALSQSELTRAPANRLALVVKRQALALRVGPSRLFASLADNGIEVLDLDTGLGGRLELQARELWSAGGRMFALVEGTSEGLLELDVVRTPQKLQVLVLRRWAVNVQATRFLRGGFVQDCLGTPVLGLVLPGAGMEQGTAPSLRGYDVQDGFFLDSSNVWLSALRRKDGESVRMRLSLVPAQSKWVVEEEHLCDQADLYAAASLSGVGVVREGDDLLVSKGAASKRITQVGLPEHLQLFSLGQGIAAVLDGQVFRLSLS